MNCRTANKQILARLDEVLSGEQEAALQQHVKECTTCALRAQESDLAFQWLQEAVDAEPSENFEWRLKLRLAELDRNGTHMPLFDVASGRHRWTLRFAVSAAAAAVLVLSVGLIRFQPQPTPDSAPGAQTAPSVSVPRLVNPGRDTGTVVARPHSDLPQMTWPRPVPVRFGAPLGPRYPQAPAPSILGPVRAEADTIEPQQIPRGGDWR